MLIFFFILGGIALVAIGSTVVQVIRDGYGRVADRPELRHQTARGDLIERGFARSRVRCPTEAARGLS
jgi:hypothetical protein